MPGVAFANNIIRKYTDILSDKYPYVVIDNEAGMEHLSRRTTHNVDLLLVISDPTKKGVLTANRINSLVDELQLEVDQRRLIINRVSDDNFEKLKNCGIDLPFKDMYNIENDENIFHLDMEGRPVFDLRSDSAAVKKFFKILDSCNIP